ncbi:MAG: 2-amino-4-hydroxy-6-hydroxymethyldihydropteridine diphosphokinase [Actinobacteria bacterium]|nr:2-amino-4-hydroxy-6-hydroxymethyldihydropteridine diphosphokinase [Actinomycetota bacterium]
MSSAWALPGREVFAFLGLGSNVGDRLTHLQAGIDHLHAARGILVDAVSSVYETVPVGGPAQGDFLNMAARVATTRSPRGLLRACHRAEQARHRTRTVRWGPRTLDIDILLYDERRIATSRLQVPHPRLTERPFALVPLIEVAPGASLPDGRSLVRALAARAPIDDVVMIGRQVVVP